MLTIDSIERITINKLFSNWYGTISIVSINRYAVNVVIAIINECMHVSAWID